MRIFFACLALVSIAVLTGCYKSHRLAELAPVPTADAGEIPVPDGGPMVEPDAGPVVTADAGSDAYVLPIEDAGIAPSSIEAFDMRPSAILVGGEGVWEQVASFWVGPDETFDAFDAFLSGDAADTEQVAVASDGRILGTNVFPSGIDQTVSVALADSWTIPAGERRRLDIWVRIPNLVANSTVGGVHDGAALSGDTFRAGVIGFIHEVGGMSVHEVFSPVMGNEFVIRKSRPTFTHRMLANFMFLNDADQHLYRFQVSADAAGPIEISRIGMNMSITSTAGRVCNLRLRRGSVEMSPSDYSISGPMFWDGERCWTAGALPLIIRFNETVTGPGNEYTVFGTPSGFVAGDTITVSFNRLADDRVATGYLRSIWASTSTDIALDLSPYGAPDSTRDTLMGHLIWSDLSEVPHSAAFGRDGGSRDWTNGYLIEDLTQTQTITR
ncbi:MAG: hypothetical protein NUW08_01000 [Candidatus Uhrbacteria bacterium]|nr:hypothetical protein [Candidatus Uhrbacteria bacterium]